MIVVDTNTVAYLYLPTEYTADVEQLLESDCHWLAPSLWRSEFRNILALYMRKAIIDLDTAYHMQSQAEALLATNEYQVDSLSVLTLAQESGCSAYDCEFISLAKTLETTLITADRKLQKIFPRVAVSAKTYTAGMS